MDDDQPITIVNMAKSQYTLADYELAQEEYRRKTAAREAAKAARAAGPGAARHTSKADAASNISQIGQLLARSDISPEDRAMLERRMQEEKMADAFAAR
jgi:hypothetical protein